MNLGLQNYGLRVWMGRSIDWNGLILQDYNEMIKSYAWYKHD
jgi:hypothetical protein